MEADIAVIGGSGLYSLFDKHESLDAKNKYGSASGTISVAELEGKRVAFLPRHGNKHTIPPHKVPYRANIQALSELGVKMIIGTCAVGSLYSSYKPGDFVFFDQFANMTCGRDDTFFDEDEVVHVSMAYPYCDYMRRVAEESSNRMNLSYHNTSTLAVVNGPRFSTVAESKLLMDNGFHCINMTQYPEVALAREKQICYLGVGVITDYDAGLVGKIIPVSFDEVNRVFAENMVKLKGLIMEIVSGLNPEKRTCSCRNALDGAKVNV
jgi:5'-methylthioadenosine phosphorylase